MATWKQFISLFVGSILGVGLVTAVAPSASAESTYCGHPLFDQSQIYEQGLDAFPAFADSGTDSNLALLNSGLGMDRRTFCQVAWIMVDSGARSIVLGALSEVAAGHQLTRVQKAVFDWAANKAMESAPTTGGSGATPSRIPPVGPAGTYLVSWTDAEGLWLRGGPGNPGSLIKTMPPGSPIQIVCQTHGQWVQSPVSLTDIWDLVVYTDAGSGATTIAWASDAFINTETNRLVAPLC